MLIQSQKHLFLLKDEQGVFVRDGVPHRMEAREMVVTWTYGFWQDAGSDWLPCADQGGPRVYRSSREWQEWKILAVPTSRDGKEPPAVRKRGRSAKDRARTEAEREARKAFLEELEKLPPWQPGFRELERWQGASPPPVELRRGGRFQAVWAGPWIEWKEPARTEDQEAMIASGRLGQEKLPPLPGETRFQAMKAVPLQEGEEYFVFPATPEGEDALLAKAEATGWSLDEVRVR